MLDQNYHKALQAIENAAQGANRPVPRLLAVSKLQPTGAIAQMAALGQREFGENYVQEAIAKQTELADPNLIWHMIGPLQSNKCKEVAEHFDWLHSLDRVKLVKALHRFRTHNRAPLNVLIQVNIDDEDSKSGCRPDEIDTLADEIARSKHLKLRGLMAIPAPHDNPELNRASFKRLRKLFDTLKTRYAELDTLSMGMSDDFAIAIEEGSSLVRIGTALFGPRNPKGAT